MATLRVRGNEVMRAGMGRMLVGRRCCWPVRPGFGLSHPPLKPRRRRVMQDGSACFAASGGLYDQAHLCRVFRRVTA